jgi:hypothetical protein
MERTCGVAGIAGTVAAYWLFRRAQTRHQYGVGRALAIATLGTASVAVLAAALCSKALRRCAPNKRAEAS